MSIKKTILMLSVYMMIFDISATTLNKSQMDVIRETSEIISKRHVDDIQQSSLLDAALSGMTESLDRYSHYLSKNNFNELNTKISGRFSGIGITLDEINNKIVILDVMKDSPASEVQIEKDDVIKMIDGLTTKDMKIDRVISLIRGIPGSTVTIQIEKPNGKIIDVKILRSEIKLNTISSYVLDDIMILKIFNFTDETHSQILQEMSKIMVIKGIILKALIIDIRDNPGGSLDQAVRIANLFLEDGKIITSIHGKQNILLKEFYTDDLPDIINDTPIAVIINRYSASAAEILASALRENNRAITVGERSFGKGSVQDIIPLTSYPGSYIKITIAKYLTPNKNKIDGIGVEPDIMTQISNQNNIKKEYPILSKDNDINAAIAVLNNKSLYMSILKAKTKIPKDK